MTENLEINREEISLILQSEFPDLDGALVAAIAGDVDSIEQGREQCSCIYFESIIDNGDEGDVEAPLSLGGIDTSSSDGTYSTESVSGDLESQPIYKKLDFLAMCFPSENMQQLRTLLSDCQNNVSNALDQLLNMRFINENELTEPPHSRQESKDWTSVSVKKPPKNRRRRKKAEQGGLQSASSSIDDKTIASFLQELATVSRLVNVPESVAIERFEQNSYSMTSTILSLVDGVNAWGLKRTSLNENIASMTSMIGGIPTSVCYNILLATKNDLESSTELALMLCEAAREEGKDLGELASNTGYVSLENISDVVERLTMNDADGFKPVVGKKSSNARIGRSHTESALSSQSKAGKLSAAEIQQIISKKSNARSEMLEKGVDVYRRRYTKRLHPGASTYYSESARDLSAELEHYRLEYARAILRERRGDPYSFDFHGMTTQVAGVIASEVLEEWWKSTTGISPRPHFRLITGRGVHSSDGRSRLMPFLLKTLGGVGWKLRVYTGYIEVYGFREYD